MGGVSGLSPYARAQRWNRRRPPKTSHALKKHDNFGGSSCRAVLRLERDHRCGRTDRLRRSFPVPAFQGAQVRNDGVAFFVVRRETFDHALEHRDAIYFPEEF